MTRFTYMSESDLPFAVKLSSQEQWGTPTSDFRRILHLSPHGSFVAREDNLRVGMITSMTYGRDLAWIGNVIVDRHYRQRHIGRGLMQCAVEHLTRLHVKHIGLYCFENNVEFYKKLGFIGRTQFVRLRRTRKRIKTIEYETRQRPSLSALLYMDQKTFGADRSKLIRSWITGRSGTYFGFTNHEKSAFLIVKRYSNMFDFGPGAAFNASKNDLRKLLVESIGYACRKPIEISCLGRNRRILRLLFETGFRPINRGFRMYWNHDPQLGDDQSAIIIGFPDKG